MTRFSRKRQIILVMTVCILLCSLSTEAFEDNPIGWASMDGGTSGGEGGTVVTVSTREELLNYAQQSGKYIIQIDGTIELQLQEQVMIGSDKILIGLGNDSGIRYGGLLLEGVNNVIIRNLKIWDSYDDDWSEKESNTDGIAIYNSHHVWIDHCELSAHADGLLDVTAQSDYVTISWCVFSNHNKAILIGAGDAYTPDRDKLRVTLHHNYFDGISGRGLFQRVPSVRFGDVHVFNNYYDGVGVNRTGGTAMGYSIMSRIEADVLVENNYFKDTLDPHEARSDGTNPDLEALGNIYEEGGGAKSQTGRSFDPPYPYELDNAAEIPAIVADGAGVGTLTVVTVPPIISDGPTTPPEDAPNTPVPEPGTIILLGIGLVGLLGLAKRRSHKK